MEAAVARKPKIGGRYRGRALALALIFALVAGAAAAAGGLRLRVAAHDGFGRIVFDWPSPVAYRARIEDGVLRVTFDRRIAAALDSVPRILAAYVRDARVEADGRTARFSLTGPFTLRSFVYEKSIVVDLIGGAAKQAKAAKAAPAAPRIAVRVGEHRGYSRLVFDWRQGVDYRVSRKDGVARLRFDRPAEIALGRVNAAPPRNLLSAKSRIEGKRTLVGLALAPGVRIRHFRSGAAVVVDLLDPVAKAKAPADKPEKAKKRPPPAPSKKASADAPRPTEKPKAAPAPAAPVEVAGPPAKAGSEPPERAETTADGAKAKAPPAADAPAGKPGLPAPPPAAAAAETPDLPAPPVETKGRKPAVPAQPPPGALGVDMAATAEVVRAKPLSATAAQLTLGPPKLGITVHAGAERTEVRFIGGTRLAAAAFQRNGVFWVVFPRVFAVDAARIDAIKTPAYESFSRLAIPNATVLRFRLRPGIRAGFLRRERAWVATFARDASPPSALRVEEIDNGPRGSGVRIAVADVADKIEIVDPSDDARLVAVPVRISGAGVVKARLFKTFELLASVQGIAVRSMTPGLGVHASLSGVEIVYNASRAKQEIATAEAERAPSAKRTAVTLFDAAALRRPDSALYRAEEEMEQTVATAPSVRRTRARMAYARFLFANGLYPEALGVARLIARDDPKVARDPALRMIRGASRLMMGRVKLAKRDLGSRALDRFDDVALWRGVLAVREGDPAAAVVQFTRAGALWRDLPPMVREEVGLLAAEAAIDAGSLNLANRYLDAVLKANPSPVTRDRASYIAGRIQKASGDEAEAIATWDKLAQSPDRYTRAHAEYQRMLVALAAGEIDRKKAAATLERLRYVWRGDAFELAVLQKLAEIYFADKAYEKGLFAMKEAVTHFADYPAAAGLAGRMNAMFADLFLNGTVDELPPRKVLTLFYGFRELMPTGSSGDRVIQALVDRLVAVDLLDQAGELLEHQVNYRLEGVERARAGAQLAGIRLMDRKAKKAIAALDESKVAGMPRVLVDRRRHLRAQALVQLGRDEEALALLKNDESRDAKLLRADIFWRANDWRRVARTLSDLLAGAKLAAPLDPQVSRRILRLAVAYALIPDRKALARLRKRFGPVMAGDPNRNTFDLITADVDRSKFSLRDLPAAIAQVDGFEAFMADMRARLKAKAGAPRAIN